MMLEAYTKHNSGKLEMDCCGALHSRSNYWPHQPKKYKIAAPKPRGLDGTSLPSCGVASSGQITRYE
jgi:hypothetical protein